MKKALRNHWQSFAAILALSVTALLVGGVILAKQRFTLPHWVPILGGDFVTYKVELPTAQSLTPGQGQTVDVAGVPVGEISAVDLHEGRALVTLKIRRKYTPIYRDATVLVRPKTGLNDMVLELSPGSKAARALPEGAQLPEAQTLANVNLDEILASLDGDTRDYLTLLIGGLGEGLRGKSARLAADFKRLDPTLRDLEKIGKALAARHRNIARTIHNFGALSRAVAGKDRQLAALVQSSDAVFRSFARQDDRLREALSELPGTLGATNSALGKADKLAVKLGPTLSRLRPGARALGPALEATRPFLRTTTPIIASRLRPFVRDARPVVRDLRPAADDLAKLTPDLVSSFKNLNYLLNELAFDDPKDAHQSYLFWLAWVNHAAGTVFSTGDAHGPVRRGLILAGCSTLAVLDQLQNVNPNLGALVTLLNPVRASDACPQTSQSGSTIRTTGGRDAATVKVGGR